MIGENIERCKAVYNLLFFLGMIGEINGCMNNNMLTRLRKLDERRMVLQKSVNHDIGRLMSVFFNEKFIVTGLEDINVKSVHSNEMVGSCEWAEARVKRRLHGCGNVADVDLVAKMAKIVSEKEVCEQELKEYKRKLAEMNEKNVKRRVSRSVGSEE